MGRQPVVRDGRPVLRCARRSVEGALSSAADSTARERATYAEVLREPVLHLHTELARRFAGKPQPGGERERDAADQAIVLWNALWELYSGC